MISLKSKIKKKIKFKKTVTTRTLTTLVGGGSIGLTGAVIGLAIGNPLISVGFLAGGSIAGNRVGKLIESKRKRKKIKKMLKM